MGVSVDMNSRGTRLIVVLVLSSLASLCRGQQAASRPDMNSGYPKQPDDVMSGKYDDLKFEDGYFCTRLCRENEHKVCYYEFYIEPYTTLNRACGNCPNVTSDCFLPQCVTSDGFEKAILTVNRRKPGPSIQVCKGDTVVVDVINQMAGRSTTIHWHGLHQRGTPFMDGVPYVTQCPILEAESFRYRFRTDEAGTSWWHSHDGLQKVDGVLSSLIVREPDSENLVRRYYDFDLPSHVVVIEDLMHTTADERLPGYFRYRERGQHPVSYTINGRGVQVVNKTVLVGNTPLSEFIVREGFRYRFRLIGATCLSCPYRFTVQDHRLTAIAIDRNPIDPVTFGSIDISAGERYDVVIEARQPVDAYWMIVEGLEDCVNVSQVAVLRYEGGPSRPTVPLAAAFPDNDALFTLNPRDSRCDETSLSMGRCISQLTALERSPPQVLQSRPDVAILLYFNFYIFQAKELFYSGTYHDFFVAPSGSAIAGQMNNRSYTSSPSPLLTQLYDNPPDVFCENAGCTLNGTAVCDCTHIIHVGLNDVIEFILVHAEQPNSAMLNHPFHIHGHDFYVIEEGRLPGQAFSPQGQAFVHELQRKRRPNLKPYLPMKDTVSVSNQGYTVTRITANNPGFWFFHCHFAYHQETGMAFTLMVGDYEDIPPPPPGFPKCGDYLSQPIAPLGDPRTFHVYGREI